MTPTLLAIATTIAITFCYAGLCAAAPFGTCRRCHGAGCTIRTDRRGRPRPGKACRRCQATGRRIRVGRWLYNRLARTYRAGTR
ncbi:hypothetical protein AB0G74_03030 [Streptomyces sp. NPDC020875]|uniref:hypothetical protein n=1 Tax=Streptomyces sp. NPDC020875 TaxID=3154898 RepID=UPI00340631DE